MPTTNFAYNNAAILWLGAFQDGANAGHNYRVFTDFYGQFRVRFTGTGCTLAIHSDFAQPLDVILDGATSTPTVPALSVWSTLTLASGLAEGTHELVVRIRNAAVGFGVYVEKDTNSLMLQVTGAAPALAAPTCGGVTCSSPNVYIPATDTTNFRAEGMQQVATNGDMTFVDYSYNDGRVYVGGVIRFRGNPTAILIFGSQIDFWVTVKVDGVPRAPSVIGPGNAGIFDLMVAASGLDGGTREYEVIFEQRGASEAPMEVYQVVLVGGSVAATPAAARNILASYGDSRTSGWWQTGLFSSQTYGALLAARRGLQHVNAGISASTVSSSVAGAGAGSYGESRQAGVTRYGAAVSIVAIQYGINDLALGVPRATFKSAFQAMLQGFVDVLPSASIWVIGILPAPYFEDGGMTQADIDSFNTASQEAIALVTPHANITYFAPPARAEILPGESPLTYFLDRLHQNAAGYGLQARIVENQLAGIGGGAVPSIGSPLIRGVA